MVRKHPEQGCTAGTGTTENKEHLSRFDAAMAFVENSPQRGLVTRFSNMLRNVELGQNVLVDGGICADDFHTQILPGHAKFATSETRRYIPVMLFLEIGHQTPVLGVRGAGGVLKTRSRRLIGLIEGGVRAVCIVSPVEERSWLHKRWVALVLHGSACTNFSGQKGENIPTRDWR
jgi:hypothetical protein